MPRQQERSAGADLQVVGGDRHALVADIADLAQKTLGIHGDAVADDGHDALSENARGEQMQGKFAEFIDDGMARVAAALIAHDNVVIGADEVDHAALAFIAPVDADDCTIHNYLPIYKFLSF